MIRDSNHPENATPPDPPGRAAGFGSGVGRAAGGVAQPSMFETSAAPPSAWSANAPTQPAPLPKRPRHRLFSSLLVLILTAAGVFAIWHSFFRFSAYGVVSGRIVDVSAPREGVIRTIHVQEGDRVRQGQLMVSLSNMELEHNFAKTSDELRLERASLDAELAGLKWQSQLQGDLQQKALAEYLEFWGTVLFEEAKLAELQEKLSRLTELKKLQAASEYEYESVRLLEAGQKAKVEKLKSALDEMKQRVDLTARSLKDESGRIRPHLVRIETLQAEVNRLREKLETNRIYAPANGRVVKIHQFPGETAETGEPLLEILQDGSVEIVLYLPQRRGRMLPLETTVDVQIAPGDDPVTCRVIRYGDRLESAPANLKRYYRADSKLRPVHLKPISKITPQGSDDGAMLGSEVRLPRLQAWP